MHHILHLFQVQCALVNSHPVLAWQFLVGRHFSRQALFCWQIGSLCGEGAAAASQCVRFEAPFNMFFACRLHIEVHKVAHICNVIHAHHAGVDMHIPLRQVGIPFRQEQH